MSKKLLIIIPCFFLSNIILSSDGEKIIQEKKSGTITGTIKVRGVRDARDVVVFIEQVEGTYQPTQEKPILDQLNMVFIPHVLPILVGTTVQFTNSDEVRHNVFSPSKIKPFNLGTYSKGITREVMFDETGVVTLLCNVHTEMSAFIIVLENPYFAKTGPDGTFTIKDVPEGEYIIKTWHEKLKEKSLEVIVKEGKTVEANFNLRR
jgi:plastocyanin